MTSLADVIRIEGVSLSDDALVLTPLFLKVVVSLALFTCYWYHGFFNISLFLAVETVTE